MSYTEKKMDIASTSREPNINDLPKDFVEENKPRQLLKSNPRQLNTSQHAFKTVTTEKLEHDLNKEIKMLKKKANKIHPIFILAVRRDNPSLIRVLARSKYDKRNEKDNNGDTALHISIREGYFECADELLDLQPIPNIDARNLNRSTPLHDAVRVNNLSLIKRLLAMGAYVNAAEQHLVTPLILAARNGALGAVEILLKYQPERNLMDAYFKTAADYSSELGFKPITDTILNIRNKKEIDQSLDEFPIVE